MKQFKKITAIALALVMVMALASTVFADSTVKTGNYDAHEGTNTDVDATSNTITLSKTIVYFNPDGTAVREPSITYQFVVTPETVYVTTTITDKDGHGPVRVNNGDTDGLTNPANIVIAPSTPVNASAVGEPKVYTTTIGVVPNNFPHAGVYRYKIEETALSAVDAAGITRDGAYDSIRYLDVYIQNGDPVYNTPGDPTSGIDHYELKLQGAVIFKKNTAIDGSSAGTYTEKSIGFDVTATSSYATDDQVDRYFTYNLTVTKTTTGNMADKTHEFPFEVNLSKAVGLTNDATVDVSVTNGTLTSGATSALDADETITATLKDGGELSIKGIPYYPNTTAPTYATINSVKETNDTVDYYAPSMVKTNLVDNDPALAMETTKLDPGTNRTTTGTAHFQADQYAATLAFTNTLEEISPTGYVVRIAPYALMLAVGVALLGITRRRKEQEEA